ncbi:sigma-70 family RNA polymerase sigma factor [Streptomyces sp. NPDC056049]|uniref:sigma-70 family RNA polymerase sigma factor n=1 Tax=Streptomyces sp. NPDC056049 TaxID=3345693 RepID=UPI0035DF4E12
MTDDGSYRQVLGDPPADLAPAALEQWNEVAKDFGSFHRWIRSQVGARHHADDVLSAAKEKFHGHLRRNGPVTGKPREYFGKICRNAAKDHFAYLKKLSEDFLLDDASPSAEKWREDSAPDKDLLALVEVKDQLRGSLRILKEELSPNELTVYVLREAHKYDTAAIAAYTGSTQDAVRQTLMRAKKKLKGPVLKRKLSLFRLVPE